MKNKARSTGSFLAVPAPYYDPSTHSGNIYKGIIQATKEVDINQEFTGNWGLRSIGTPPTSIELIPGGIRFWSRIKGLNPPGPTNAFPALPGCLSEDFQPDPNAKSQPGTTYLKLLVLCAMQKFIGADVAMIQSRDLFDWAPELNPCEYSDRGSSDLNVQQMLDRLIWKGDLVTLLHVPGKALKKALDTSEHLRMPKPQAWPFRSSEEENLKHLEFGK